MIQRERAANLESTRGSVKKSYSGIKEFYDDLQKNPEETLTHKLKNGDTLKLQAKLLTSKTKPKKSKTNKIKYNKRKRDTHHHAAFFNEEFVKTFDDNNDAFFDGTFDFCADIKNTRQVLVILGKKHFVVSYYSF